MSEAELDKAIDCANDCIGFLGMQLATSDGSARHGLIKDLRLINADLSRLLEQRADRRRLQETT